MNGKEFRSVAMCAVGQIADFLDNHPAGFLPLVRIKKPTTGEEVIVGLTIERAEDIETGEEIKI